VGKIWKQRKGISKKRKGVAFFLKKKKLREDLEYPHNLGMSK
jgi:hypothetical protein